MSLDYAQARDEELVGRLALQDERALEGLYDRYGRVTHSLVLKMVRDPARAEEISQEVFLKLWRRPESFQPGRGAFPTWLLSVAHHRAVDDLRSRRWDVQPLTDEDGLPRELADESTDLAEAAWIREQRSAVRVALATLPASQRQALELAYFAGLTQREIADRLGQPLGTVKTRCRLAMQKLRTALAGVAEANGNGHVTGTSGSSSVREVRHVDL